MKRFLLLFILFSYSYLAHTQITHITILLGMTEAEVTSYYVSLNNLKYNPNFKIEKDVSDDGDLMLSIKFASSVESYYSCRDLGTKFYRKDGTEICTGQVIAGHMENIG